MATAVSSRRTAPRRPDLDALRVGAFLLLIFYHLGMFYVPWSWHVKSSHVVPTLAPWMGSLNPWRLTLLFVISGSAARFMAMRLPPKALVVQRSKRLLIPLLFGMTVVVAPQSWAQVAEQRGYQEGFLAFWSRYLSFDQSFDLILPTYNHLWFVAYLWLYTMVAALLAPTAPWADRFARRLLSGPGLFVAPALLFGFYRATAGRAWGETHIIWADGYLHLQYGTAFALGLLMARQDQAWTQLRRWRLASLAAAVTLLAVGLSISNQVEGLSDWRGGAFAFLREAYAWAVICALFGYANRFIKRGSPLLSHLSSAVFPAYIVHQTTIVLVGHAIKPLGLPLLMEATIILAATAISCAAAYGLALAVPILRLPLGLAPKRA